MTTQTPHQQNLFSKLHPRGYIFIGMSGSGKSTLGKIIAKKINYSFVDSDHLIEAKFSGTNLYKIVDKFQGNLENFIEIESEVINNIHLSKTILATGGSACYSGKIIKEKKCMVIYLYISWELLRERIGDFSKRGVICLEKDLQAEYNKRIELYKNLCNVKINCNGKSIKDLKNEILELIL